MPPLQVAGALAQVLGAARILTVPSGSRSIWAWAGTSGAPDRTALEAMALGSIA